MKTSESTATIDKSLFNVQCSIGKALKDKENDFFKSKYADLLSVWNACHSALKENGLFVLQPIVIVDEKNAIETWIKHTSGEYYAGQMFIEAAPDHKVVKNSDKEIRSTVTPQAVGSAITYFRRYSLVSMLCIMQDDDDGNAGSGRGGNRNNKVAMITPGNVEEIGELLSKVRPGSAKEEKKALVVGILTLESGGPVDVDTIKDLTKVEAISVIDALKAMSSETKTTTDDTPATPQQVKGIYTVLRGNGRSEDEAKKEASKFVGREIKSMNDLTKVEASSFLDMLKESNNSQSSR